MRVSACLVVAVHALAAAMATRPWAHSGRQTAAVTVQSVRRQRILHIRVPVAAAAAAVASEAVAPSLVCAAARVAAADRIRTEAAGLIRGGQVLCLIWPVVLRPFEVAASRHRYSGSIRTSC